MRGLLLLAATLHAQPARPTDAIAAMVDALRSHSIIAIGNVEGRGNAECHRFQVELIRNPRFAAAIDDIVVEFGNARHQAVIDRFVRGGDVPYDVLRRVWQDTTQVEPEFDLPIYEAFYRAVRAVNAATAPRRQLRVILADPPIDWGEVHTREELDRAIGDRDKHAAEIILREVVAKGRRALLIFGGQHLLRRRGSISARLEQAGTKVFSALPETRRDLRPIEPDIAAWPIPSVSLLRGTALGAMAFGRGPDSGRMEDAFDALLYLGPPESMTLALPDPSMCADKEYLEMRLGRLALIPPPPGARISPAEQLRVACGLR